MAKNDKTGAQDNGRRVRVEWLPTYSQMRRFIGVLIGRPKGSITGLQKELWELRGTPQKTVDWKDPDAWIDERVTGEYHELALAIWTKSGVNPRYTDNHWRLIQNYELLAEDADGTLKLAERGIDFIDHEFGKAEVFLDEQEGLIKLLTLVADAGSASASRSALREPWKEYLTRHSGYQARATVDSTLSSRLNHLVHRDLVKRDGSDYEITKAGLDHLKRAGAPDSAMAEARWDSYLATAKERQEQIDRQEDYKATVAEEVTKAREALLSDDDDWPRLVVAAIKHKDNNIIFHVNKSKLTNWIEGNRNEAREALLGMWSEGDRSPGDRVGAFDAKVPESVWPRTAVGTRLNSASYLMMGLDAQRYPPYQRTPFTKAYRRLGYPIPTTKDAGGVYEHVLGFLGRLVEEARKRGMDRPSTRLDAQSVVWQLRDAENGRGPQPTRGFAKLLKSLDNAGLLFSPELVANYILALQTKRFAILTGISGTGKTRIAKAVAEHFQPTVTRRVTKRIPGDAVEIEVRLSHLKHSLLTVPKVMASRLSLLGQDAPPADRRIGIRYPGGETELTYWHKGSTDLYLSGEFKKWYRSNLELGDRVWLRVLEDDKSEPDKLEIGLPATEFEEQHLENYEVVPVRPDWVDNRGLLGYLNPLTNEYSTTPFLNLLLRAREEEKRAADAGEKPHPFFVILDEMNLARVEHYFSDFLSALESGAAIPLHENQAIESGKSESGPRVPRELKVPGNVLFTGTVNVDETTYMFSPKVLDRAFTIEFDQVDLEGFTTGEGSEEASGLDLAGVEDALNLLPSGSSGGDWKPSREDWVRFSDETEGHQKALLQLHGILEKQHRHFGYRVANEIARFVNLAREQAEDPGAAADAAFDLALLQKVLPKFHGTQQELEFLLEQIFRFAVQGGEHGLEGKQSVKVDEWRVVAGRLTASSADDKTPAYPRTGAKVLRMLQRLRDRGFTSFIE